MRSLVRSTAALVAASALAVTGLVAASGPATAADEPGPAHAAADWMESQLVDGVLHYDDGTYSFDDIALTADFGFALAKQGGYDDAVADIVAVVSARAHDDWYTYTPEGGGTTTLYAGALAKAAAFADATDQDPTDFGGQDLIAMLEDTVSTDPATLGRVEDVNNADGDTNVFGQAFALETLFANDSASAAPVLAFLLQQQCSEGWFRLDFAARDAADQTCDGDPGALPDTDGTAMALAAMMTLHDDALVPAIDKAEAWLLSTQYPNGSWDGRQDANVQNTNSTGLVGSVLGELGDLDAAHDAAAYVRAHQLTNVGPCQAYQDADLGAVAYDDPARKALKDGIGGGTVQDQTRRATANALAVLPYAQSAGDTHVLMAPDYVRAGGTAGLGVINAAPGEALCARVLPSAPATLGWADKNGEAQLAFKVPNEQGTSKVRVWSSAKVLDTLDIRALGKARLKVEVKNHRAPAGSKQTIVVRGLAPGEYAQVSIDWPSRGSSGSGEASGGQANAHGVFKVTTKVPNAPGTAKVDAQGQFKNRKGHASFIVTR